MNRGEIDLREKIANEILDELDNSPAMTVTMAVGVIRQKIWHGQACPCSKCLPWTIISCSEVCSSIRKMEDTEFQRLRDSMNHYEDTLYYCGHCRNGQNEWVINDMLFDTENEVTVTPCCHTEATEALKCYCAEGACPEDDDSLAKQERQDYLWSQGAR